MFSTILKNKSCPATEKGRGCARAQKASRLKYVLLAKQTIGNAMRQVLTKGLSVKLNERRATFADDNSAAVQNSASQWLIATVNHLIIERTLDSLLDVVIGNTLNYLLGMQPELQGLQECYPFLKAVALLAVEASITRGLVLLRAYSGRRKMSTRLSAQTARAQRRVGACEAAQFQPLDGGE